MMSITFAPPLTYLKRHYNGYNINKQGLSNTTSFCGNNISDRIQGINETMHQKYIVIDGIIPINTGQPNEQIFKYQIATCKTCLKR